MELEIYGCTQTEKLAIFEAPGPMLDLGQDTVLCPGESLELTVGLPAGSFQWGDGSNTPTFRITEPGIFSIDAREGNCHARDSIAVDYISLPDIPSRKDSIICEGLEIQLSTGIQDASFMWDNQSTDSVRTVDSPGLYKVEARNNCYQEEFEFLVETQSCGCESFYPNIFSPNTDGINDVFAVQLSPGAIDFSMTIYDRWGREGPFEQDARKYMERPNGPKPGRRRGLLLPKPLYVSGRGRFYPSPEKRGN